MNFDACLRLNEWNYTGVSEDPECFETVSLKFKLLRDSEQIRLRVESSD